jgi:myo-inositol 2-dehydrogenase / D-chiro-inositol 1-dehydrogenase
MTTPDQSPLLPNQNRRNFLKTSLAAAGGVAAASGLSIARGAHAAGSDVIRIGLVGCGSRGPGAAVDAMTADPGVRLVAMGDVFASQVKSRRAMLKRLKPEQVQVDDAHCFAGLDSYKHVIAASDVVLVACAAKYHSTYLRAAVEAGKHVFVEKPHAVDPVGVREVTAACQLAKQKGLSVMSGLHSRHEFGFQEAIKRIHDGAIGDIVSIAENFLRGPYNVVGRNPKYNEVEFQFSAQMHFTWLSGDDVDQSLVHNVDRATWALKEEPPVKCHGLGGRSASFGVIYGNTFDHHSVVYQYANGRKMYAFTRTQNGCYDEYSSAYYGTKGRCYLSPSAHYRIVGETNWTYRGPIGEPHRREHEVLFAAIRAGSPVNAGEYMARSTLVAVMGQLACYTGKELTWDQVSKSNFVFLPKAADVTLDMEPPVKPDAEGNYPVPMPGVTTLKI